jgi:hypothetical protein
MAQAMTDGEFYDVLKFRAAADSPVSNTAEMRSVLRQAMAIDGFVSWREAHGYSQGVDRVIDRLRDMLDDDPEDVIELVEYAMELWEEAIQRIDDSDGCMGMLLDDLHELHFSACTRAKPDPVEMAIRLFNRCINSEWDMFRGAYETYGSVLGKTGRAQYRSLVEEEWRTLPTFGPGEENPERYGRGSRIQEMMIALAGEDGDLDRIIEVMSRDLSEAYDYLAIAERCRQAKNYTLARQWAEQGLHAFPGHYDTRLHDFLAEEYMRDKRSDDAVAVIWETFEACPGLDRYQSLAKYAREAKAWTEWREEALTHVRKGIVERKKSAGAPRYRWERAPDHSLLVRIFLWENDVEAAWVEARKGDCSNALWLQLAEEREKDHPEDAVTIYRRQIEPLLQQKNNQSYEEAVDYLGQIHRLMVDMGKESEFKQDLLAIKTEWKRLRNFIKYVERKPWGKVS